MSSHKWHLSICDVISKYEHDSDQKLCHLIRLIFPQLICLHNNVGAMPTFVTVHEEYIEMRIKNVCKGGVDAVIDFVSSARTVSRATKVLKEVGIPHIVFKTTDRLPSLCSFFCYLWRVSMQRMFRYCIYVCTCYRLLSLFILLHSFSY